MRRALYITVVLFLYAPEAFAAAPWEYIGISGEQVETEGTTLRLSFTAGYKGKRLPPNLTLTLVPHVTDGVNTVSFRGITAAGKNKRLRHISQDSVRTSCYELQGAGLEYTSDIEYQPWMKSASLVYEVFSAGCRTTASDSVISRRLEFPAPDQEPLPVALTGETMESSNEAAPVDAAVLLPGSDADSVAQVLPFVLPASEFDEDNPVRLYDDERERSLTVYFSINKFEIDPAFGQNRQTLNNLIAAIEIIRQSGDSDIHRVVVAGFSSPDGPFELNDRLAWERAVSVKEYIMKNSGLADGLISLYNGSSDWQGLRILVDADPDLPARAEVLDLICNTPVWSAKTRTGRITTLRKLHNGEPYRYIAEHIFPKLRNGAFIRVYYENADTGS